ncbi:MAG TPA: metal-sensitive transcriptional regulator [Bdellovibrionota bacterium]
MDKLEKAAKENNACGSCEPSGSEKPKGSRAGKNSTHPDHSKAKARINRVKGQLDAVSRMIDERKYCPDILQQVRAATNALRGLEAEVLRGHLRGCVKRAFETKNSFETNDKIEEIVELWNR